MIEKILLDTDIGSDIDDAVCLAYLLSNPDCDLLGITTVSGEPVKRAMIADAICKAAKKNTGIYPGIAAPLLGGQKQPLAPHARALDHWKHDIDFPEGQAVEFLRKTIRQYPHEITLLCIGPLTNIAVLFSIDPEIPLLLKSLVLMCGVFTNKLAGVGPLEWNAICDPYAAEIVYRAPVSIHRSIGLDVTCQVTMDKQAAREKFKCGILKPVLDFANIWFEKVDEITFHDPLAAVTIFNDKICKFNKGKVDVELQSEKLRGLTFWTPDETEGLHEIALEVDREEFINHYFAIVEKYDANLC